LRGEAEERYKKAHVWHTICEVIVMAKESRDAPEKAGEEKKPNRKENMNQHHNIKKQALGPNTKK